MRVALIAFSIGAALASASALAHGPQIQLTRDNNQITTRRLFREEPYDSLSSPTKLYVIPLMETAGIWYVRPNNEPSATIPGSPEYLSGPGVAYGHDQLDGGPRHFGSGFRFELRFVDGLQWWDGSAFVDPGFEEIEAFRSSGTPAITNDTLTLGSPATLAYGNVSATYNSNAHSSASFRLLGDGVNAAVEGDDGIYLLTMLYASTEPGLGSSVPFQFLLHKNADSADIHAAVEHLGLTSASVQYVPEPACHIFVMLGLSSLLAKRRQR
jgi:hypothetical protein